MHLPLSRDGWLLFAACGVRSLAYGFLSVILGLYLDTMGLSTTVIGWIFTAALAGGAIVTILITSVADTIGRKQLLILGALLMALAGWLFAVNSNPLVLAVAAVFGTISPSGKEVGPFLSIEQAILPQTTEDLYRTKVFSAYNLVGSIFGAFGAASRSANVSASAITIVRLSAPSLELRCLRSIDDGFIFLAFSFHRSIHRITAQNRRFGVQRSRGM
jgi:MFS family permease